MSRRLAVLSAAPAFVAGAAAVGADSWAAVRPRFHAGRDGRHGFVIVVVPGKLRP